jgi:hypothetical protein
MLNVSVAGKQRSSGGPAVSGVVTAPLVCGLAIQGHTFCYSNTASIHLCPVANTRWVMMTTITTFLIQPYFSVGPDGCVGKDTGLVCGSNPGKGI